MGNDKLPGGVAIKRGGRRHILSSPSRAKIDNHCKSGGCITAEELYLNHRLKDRSNVNADNSTSRSNPRSENG